MMKLAIFGLVLAAQIGTAEAAYNYPPPPSPASKQFTVEPGASSKMMCDKQKQVLSVITEAEPDHNTVPITLLDGDGKSLSGDGFLTARGIEFTSKVQAKVKVKLFCGWE